MELSETAGALLDAATAVLAEEGRHAVTARRLGREIGASSMAVYTHFGGMDELMAAIWRRGFARFGEALAAATTTSDPVADWMLQGIAYRHFARSNPHLYRVMFGDGLRSVSTGNEQDRLAALHTFLVLLDRIERCVAAGRWQVDDVAVAGEVVWAQVHGQSTIELTGYFDAVGRDAETVFGRAVSQLAVGFGDEPDAADRSLRAARRRERRLRTGPGPLSASRPAS